MSLWLGQNTRSSHPEMLLEKDVLKIWSKFTGEHRCWSVISIKLLCNFIESTLRHGYSPVNLFHIFRAPFLKNISGWLLLKYALQKKLNEILYGKIWLFGVSRRNGAVDLLMCTKKCLTRHHPSCSNWYKTLVV